MFGEGFFVDLQSANRVDKPPDSLASVGGIFDFFHTTGKARKFCLDSLDNSINDAAACRAAGKLAKSPDG